MIEKLFERFPWPIERPNLPFDPFGWLHPDTSALILKRASSASLIVEVGSWLGLSARSMLDQNSNSRLVCIDTWLGSLETLGTPESIRALHDGFLANCWDYRNRLAAVRLDSVSGIKCVAQSGLKPDFVYLDGGHDFDVVSADIREVTKAWPDAPVVVDDYSWDGVKTACAASGRLLVEHGYACELL